MPHHIMMCQDTLLDLVLNPGWDGYDNNLRQRRHELEMVWRNVQSSDLRIYVLPALVSNIQIVLANERYAPWEIQEIVRDVLKIGCSNLPINYDEILRLACSSCVHPAEADLYEVMLVACAHMLDNVDALVVRRPSLFDAIVSLNEMRFPGFSIPIIGIEDMSHILAEL